MSQKTLLAREDRELPTKLSQEELVAKGRELAATLDELRAEEDAQSVIRQEAKARATEISGRVDALRGLVLAQEERRTVTVEDWAHHDEGVVRSIRLDTGEEVHSRAMTDEERQMPIDFVGPPPKPAEPEE